jgi:hypothetical protein
MTGGRDRDRTCDFCRVKGARPPRAPTQHPAPHHIIAAQRPWQTEATRCCVWRSEASFLANLWQTALRAKLGDALRLVELRGFEPLTPCMPSMRGWFTKPCRTPCPHTTAQVAGAAEGWVVGWREVARSAVSGKSLARACTAVHGMDAGAIVGALPTTDWHLRCSAVLRQLRVERRANGQASSVMADRD